MEAGLSSLNFTLPLLFFLLATILARGVARITARLLFGLECSLSCCFLFLLAGQARGFRRCSLVLAALLFGQVVLSRQSRTLTVSRNRFALGPPLGDCGVVRPGLGTEFVQKIFLCQLRRFLSVGEAGFLKSTH